MKFTTLTMILITNLLFAQNNGLFDTSFNGGNTLYLFVPNPNEGFEDLSIQSDNKILVAGYSQGLLGEGIDYSYTVFRINEDGTLDESFGTDGLVLFGEGMAEAVEVLSDGKILIVGNMNDGVGLARLNTDGSLDAGFGSEGISIIPMSTVFKFGTIYDILVLSDGKILLTGYLSDGVNKQLLVIRVDADGTVDSGFGNNGYIERTLESTNEQGDYILVQSDGKILILGETSNYLFVSRFNTDGSTDESFGTAGTLITDVRVYQFDSDRFKGRLQNDGKIVIAGYMPDPNSTNKSNYAAVRITSTGEIDESFGTGGYVNFDFDESQSQDWAHDVLISPNGTILLGGSYLNSNNFANLGIIALDPNGNVISAFGNNGRASGLGNAILAMQFDSKMKIVAGGLSTQSKGYAVARFNFSENPTSVGENNELLPDNFSLSQNYPNPFNPSTTIAFSIPNSELVTLKVYNILGNEIETLVNETKAPGTYNVNFDASTLSSGIYFYRLSSGGHTISKKMSLIK